MRSKLREREVESEEGVGSKEEKRRENRLGVSGVDGGRRRCK
jgi:hypothetical protein